MTGGFPHLTSLKRCIQRRVKCHQRRVSDEHDRSPTREGNWWSGHDGLGRRGVTRLKYRGRD